MRVAKLVSGRSRVCFACSVLSGLVLLGMEALLFSVAHAAYPDKPIKVIIGFPAGGPLDQHARLLAPKLSEILGQPILIDYKSGAGGAIGAEAVAKSTADGYTLLLANTGTLVINAALYTKLPYNTLRDFSPIARTAQQPLALLVHPSVPAKTLPEFIMFARQNPGKLNYGSAGNGGISHLVPEMFKQASTRMVSQGADPAFLNPGAFASFLSRETPRWHKVVRDSGARID